MFRSPCSNLLATAFCAPAGYYPATGYRDTARAGVTTNVSTHGYIKSSSVAGNHGIGPYLTAGEFATGGGLYRGDAMSVRCLQAFTLAFYALPQMDFVIFIAQKSGPHIVQWSSPVAARIA